MAQKDKIKELVGGGLNAYHTKSLQQMDRIEKKNKQQNHKISILSNELDNDYLTKTEEGSVISLEHSKEGMVYLDELQGNTLVNYCTDGSKEMTLNGDIDLEGTFVTTTEGVDNGKVDVMCEGNTLVNLKYGQSGSNCTVSCSDNTNNQYFILEENSKLHCKGEVVETARNLGLSWAYYPMGNIRTSLLKPNTTYTVILDNKFDSITRIYLQHGNSSNTVHKSTRKITKDIFTITTKDSFEGIVINDNSTIIYGSMDSTYKGKVDYRIIALLEGDWSENEIPTEFFEGMKSVGQDDENGHKIEILSQSKNLFNGFTEQGNLQGNPPNGNLGNLLTAKNMRRSDYIKVQGSSQYIIGNFNSSEVVIEKVLFFDINKKAIQIQHHRAGVFTTPINCSYIKFVFKWSVSSSNTMNQSHIDSSQTYLLKGNVAPSQYVNGALNKKEILLNEPLRKANDNVKDRFVKINGKLYIERNCKQLTITGNEPNVVWRSDGILGNVYRFWSNNFPNCITLNADGCVFMGSYEGVYQANAINIQISTSKIAEDNVELFVEYLKQNPLTLVIKRDEPTYEPLEINPELTCYNDATHISNNSIIPCNMKIQNSGYNAIIKPSTLYTVAIDTNKSGTIGMNLGGAKGTTTNNVLTLTTPATLTDDSLRLHGKGIKGSKVRLLEGDKTNWIPSHFEGMKSCFEDKAQEDGTYKMEILSNNKNLFDIDAEYYKAGWGNQNYQRNGNGFSFDAMDGWSSIGYEVKGHRDKTVVVSATVTCINKDTSKLREQSLRVHTETWSGENATSFLDGETKRIKFNVKLNHEGRVYFNGSSSPEGSNNGGVKWTVKDILIEDADGRTGYFPRECNKIQFSSIEPLRKWDRFVFKDGQLMIGRRTLEKTLTKDMSWSLNATVVDTNSTQFVCHILPTWGCSPSNEEILCDKKPTKNINSGSNSIWVYDKTTLVLQMRYDTIKTIEDLKVWLDSERPSVQLPLTKPTYEEIPFELQKIILEGYENGTLFFDTNIPPTSLVTYAGETPIVKSVKLNKTEVLNNTNDINDNIIPYLMDMDYRVVCLELATETQGISMARLFGGVYEMLKRDILSKRYSVDEYRHRLDAYLSVNKITEKEYEELGEMLNE